MKEELKRSGLSRGDFAAWLGVTPNTVTKWFRDPPRHAEIILEQRLRIKDLEAALRGSESARKGLK